MVLLLLVIEGAISYMPEIPEIH